MLRSASFTEVSRDDVPHLAGVDDAHEERDAVIVRVCDVVCHFLAAGSPSR